MQQTQEASGIGKAVLSESSGPFSITICQKQPYSSPGPRLAVMLTRRHGSNETGGTRTVADVMSEGTLHLGA